MNEVTKLLMDHRSVRNFEDRPLSKEQVETIVLSAQSLHPLQVLSRLIQLSE